MPISPYWTGIDDLTAPRRPRVPLRPEEELEPVDPAVPPPPPPPSDPAAPNAPTQPPPPSANPERDAMRAFLRKRYPEQYTSALGEAEGARVTPEQAAAARSRAAEYGFLGALSKAAAGIGNYGGEMSETSVPEHMKGIQDREREAILGRGRLADAADRRMDAAVRGMDALDSAEYETSRRPFQDRRDRVATEGAELEFKERQRAAASEAEKAKPDSEVSRTMRALARERWRKVFGTDMPENITAATLEKYMPEVGKEYTAILDREAKASEAEARRREAALDRQSRERIAGMTAGARTEASAGKGARDARDWADKQREKYNATPAVKEARQLKSLQATLSQLAQNPSGASDQALITLFSKTLDPNSVVRETEFAISRDNAGVMEKYSNYFNTLKSGQQLTPDQRRDMIATAQKIAAGVVSEAERHKAFYKKLADTEGVEAWKVIGQDEGGPDVAPPSDPAASTQSAAPAPSGRRVWKPGG